MATMLFYFLFVLCLFASKVRFSDGLLLTTGALFTFGAKSDLLNSMSFFFHFLYILSSFVGISLTALFITVLVNVFLGQR